MGEISAIWNKTFPESIPRSNELKWIYRDKWFRVHSLPESKRYADTEQEQQIILHRQHTLINDVVGVGIQGHVLAQLYSTDKVYVEGAELKAIGDFSLDSIINLKESNKEEYANWDIMNLGIHHCLWVDVTEKDKLLLSIANDDIKALIVNFERKIIVAPYDGGVDIIMGDRESVEAKKRLYSEWLSLHPEGL